MADISWTLTSGGDWAAGVINMTGSTPLNEDQGGISISLGQYGNFTNAATGTISVTGTGVYVTGGSQTFTFGGRVTASTTPARSVR